ncbi:MAG TPA: carboxypeptidase regulatory-like domain-containing protein [Haliscomenobacter sp.]|uniref:TonB-dependent receptor n=1 Tax=Haliscomenobacter sp. TaxID=2717303 RepID=UPI002CADD147|nr:carboxypeptidase regulatory-like domain-containing protein [Haliscomenobacter sp.]HOY15807.1 carboxypeptidase regulatory-like domain-containing protein [Haliscomenobacter sp.]
MKQGLRLLPLFAGLLLCLHANAQQTTSAIQGTATSEKGDALVAASVVATHIESGTVYGVDTRADGGFNIPNMRVGGPYTIKITYVGFKDFQVDNVFLQLGSKYTVNAKLAENTALLEGVTITSEGASIFGKGRTGSETNVGSEALTKLPTISRSAQDFYRATPASDGVSFAGRNDQYNNFTIDGAIFNNPFGLDAATPGGQADAQPISLDAIEQITVSLAPYDVTQAGFTGASVNAVTKSGTNKFKGAVFGYTRNQDLTGGKISGEKLVVPDLSQNQYGFALGGPIVKNKLFFFVNAEVDKRTDLGSTAIAAAPGRTGSNVSRVAKTDLDAVANALKTRFQYDPGVYEDYLHNTNSTKAILKLDYQISKNHTLTATYNFLDAFKQKPAHPSAIGRRGPDLTTLQFFNSGYQINNKINSGIIELRSIFGNTAANKLQVGYTAFRDARDPFSNPFPVINIQKDGIPYIVAGHEPFSIFNRLNQDVFQFTDNFNIYKGKHTYTIGTSLEVFSFDNSFNLNAYGGTFGPGFASTTAFLDSISTGRYDDDVAAARAVANANGGEGGTSGKGWALAETNVGQFAFYLQDEWTVNDKFTLNYGIRMDMPLYFNTPEKIQENIARNCCYDPTITWYNEQGDPQKFDHTKLPNQAPLISPRVGFNYDMSKDGKTAQLRGGTGLFTGRLPFVWIGNQVANPNFFFYNYTDPNFKFPQVWRSNLGYDRKLGNWTFTLDILYTKDLQAAMVRNYGLKPPTGKLQGQDTRPIYTNADRTLVFGGATNAYVFSNTNVGYSFNTSVQLRRNFKNGQLMLGYNFLDAKDASSVEAEISSDAFDRNPAINHVNNALLAPSLFGTKHRFIGSAFKTFEYGPWATTLSTFFQYAQGGTTQNDNVADFRFSYTYSGDINNDGSGLNDLIFIPTDAQLTQMNFQTAAQRDAFRSYIQQDKYLSENRGKYVEKYGILAPWYSQWDIRVAQDYRFESGQALQFTLDILNFGNMLNSNWGVRQLPINTQPLGVSVTNGVPTYSFDASLKNTFADDFSLLSRWQARVGLRFTF